MKYLSTALALLLACVAHGAAGTVESVRFKTSVTPPACRLPDSLKKNEKIFRIGLQTLPEGLLVVGALFVGSGDLGLSANQSTNLTPLISEAYSQINADGAFSNAPSALPYCFSATKPTSGHYFLYRPDTIPENPTCIVFLHGYGGNFQFYTWVLKEEFPNAVILTPSWGISWYRGSTTYLKDMLADAERRTGVRLRKPWLMGISAGGRGGFLIYNHMSGTFQGYVCIANAPETRVARSLRNDLRILMLNGTDDSMVPLPIARQQVELAKRRVPTRRYQEIKGNHFFLLSDRDGTFGAIREFMKNGDRRTTH
jgi:pimeloyl-ACP methyl ester carboxylesterase